MTSETVPLDSVHADPANARRMTIDLRCGDCLDVLKTLEAGSVDAVIADPPYGINLGIGNDKRRDGRHLGKGRYRSYDDSYENFVSIIVPRLNAALGLAKRGAVFTGEHIQEQAKATCIGGGLAPVGGREMPLGIPQFPAGALLRRIARSPQGMLSHRPAEHRNQREERPSLPEAARMDALARQLVHKAW